MKKPLVKAGIALLAGVVALQAADIATTFIALGRGFSEENPLFADLSVSNFAPAFAKLAPTVLFVALFAFAMREYSADPKLKENQILFIAGFLSVVGLVCWYAWVVGMDTLALL